VWKTLESTESILMNMINVPDYDCSSYFSGSRKCEPPPRNRDQRLETESFYLKKFHEYLRGSSLITRLLAKRDLINCHLSDSEVSSLGSPFSRPPNSSSSAKSRKRKQWKVPVECRPKLFGGSIAEYVD
ncbi:PREDICTED: SLIT-ROBO Rho GTPase-activating protein 1-like, partial [Priapulus caudatus]|uniref:SLIT-ROBO Rho GTPase-activating protein 1-like n=1 Tax=Priapulus caudatus TaxID=37621 RepID=A0ABM1F654_PRICU